MTHLTKHHRRPGHRPLIEPIEPRLFLTTAPATATTLTLSTPVTSANQPLTLTATVTSDDPATPAGTVAFFETVDLSRDPSHHYLIPDLISLPDSSARLLGTATLSPDGTASLSLDAIPSSSAIYTGRFYAAFLGTDSPFSLPNSSTPLTPAPGQTLAPSTPDPDATTTITYLIFPQNHPLSLHNAQLTVLSDLPDGADATLLTSATHAYSDQYGNESNADPSTPLTDNHPTAPYLLAASTDPLLVTITVSHVTHYAPYEDPASPGFTNYGFIPYPNLYTYTATVTPVPALAHAFDANPDLQSSLSPVGAPATIEPTSLALRASSTPTGSVTAPPTFTVSVFNPDGTQRLSRTNPAFPSNGAQSHSAQAGLIVSTGGGGGSGGLIIDGSNGTPPPPPFVAPGPFPTGTVSFFDENNTLLATVPLDADGNASFAPAPRSLPLGSHTLHATYSGDANYLPASATSDPFTLTHTPTHTDLATSAPGVHAGETFALAATVSDYDTITPTGTVTFSEGTTVLATVPLGQTSSIHLNLSAGTHTITATYAGDADCLPSSDTTTVTILDAVTNPPTPPDYHPPTLPGTGQFTDLAVTSVRYVRFPLSSPSLVPGGTLRVDVSADLTGTGLPSYPNPLISLALSADDVPGNADDIPLTATPELRYLFFANFNDAGQAHYANTYAATLPADLPYGSYHLVATIDPSNAIAEADETNNTLLQDTVTISDPAALPPITGPTLPGLPAVTPDLTGSLTFARPTAAPNARTSLTLSLTNPSSTKSVKHKYTVTYYLSADAAYTSDDTQFSRQTINANLGKKRTRSFHLNYKLPKSAPLGTRYLIAVADTPDFTVDAHLELASRKPLTIAAPHLTASVTSTKPLRSHRRTRLTLRLTNDGSAPQRGPVTFRLASADAPTKTLFKITRPVTLAGGKSATLTLTVPQTLTDPSALLVLLA